MKQQKLFHLVLSAMLIVCTTGCYDKDEIKDAEKYLFKDIQYSFEEGDGFSTYDVELLPFIMENNLNNSITTTNSPFEDTWQETTFQSNDPEAFVWMGEEDVFVNTPYMFGDELLLSGATIKLWQRNNKSQRSKQQYFHHQHTTSLSAHHKRNTTLQQACSYLYADIRR